MYRLAATLGRFLALLVVTPHALVPFERWSFTLQSGAHQEVPVR